MPKIKRRTTIELEDELLSKPEVQQNIQALLSNEDGEPKPYCTCAMPGGYGFDVQLGVFVHKAGKVFCYKPSKLYYQAAVEAGILKP